jgi:hypothetical protein
MLLEEVRTGGLDEELRKQLAAENAKLAERMNALQEELHTNWRQWDAGDATATERMVDVLHRRAYVRNLLRDIQDELS